jgi:hypothetical protein
MEDFAFSERKILEAIAQFEDLLFFSQDSNYGGFCFLGEENIRSNSAV